MFFKKTRVNADNARGRGGVTGAVPTMMINSRQYEIGEKLGEGGFGSVYAARRVEDDLKVAVKIVKKLYVDQMYFPEHRKTVPMEIALHILVDKVPEIIQLLDWEDKRDSYIIVMERVSSCMDVYDYLIKKGGKIDEDLAKLIMGRATIAAHRCLQRGVFHKDIKLENLLINTDTMEVKLIDFGCGEPLKNSSYNTLHGTKRYFCPEFFTTGKYYAEPATVYSLGVMLFAMVCGKYPSFLDKKRISKNAFCNTGLSKECCSLIQACMQDNPEERIHLKEIFAHSWFEDAKDKLDPGCLSCVDVDYDSVKMKTSGNVTHKSLPEYLPESDCSEKESTNTAGKVIIWVANTAASLYNFYNSMCIM